MFLEFSKNSTMSSRKSNPSTASSPFITPIPEFYFPIPFGTVTPETQPLLQYQRRTLRSRSYINNHTNPSAMHHRRRSNRRKMIWSGIFQLQIISIMLLGMFIGCFVLRQWTLRTVHDNHTRHSKSPGHYNSSMTSHNANPQTSSESSILSLTQGKEIDRPQLRGIEFAIICFVVFVIASGFRFAGYLMDRCDGGVGCDGSEIIDEYSEEELEQECRWSDESFGKLASKDWSSDEKADEELWGGSQAWTDGENMV